MTDSTLKVTVAADITDLRTKMALSNVVLKSQQAEFRNLAKEAVAGGDAIKAGLMPRLTELTAGITESKAQIVQFASELRKIEPAAEGVGNARMALMEVGHSARAMADGLAAGMPPMRLLAMETPRLAQAMAESGVSIASIVTPMNLAIGAAAALTAGLGYLGFQAIQTASEVRELSGIAAFANLKLPTGEIDKFVEAAGKLPDVTGDDAQAIIGNFERMKGATGPLIEALISQTDLLAKATGEKPVEASKKIAEAFAEPLANGEKFIESLHASRDAIEAFEKAASTGDQVGALKIMLNTLAESTQRVEDVTHRATEADRDAVQEMAALATEGGNAAGQLALVQQGLANIASTRTADIAETINKALNAAAAGPKTGAPVDKVREDLAEMKTTWEQSDAALLREEVQTWQQRIAVGDLSGSQLLAAQREMASAQLQLRRQTGQDEITEARQHIRELEATQANHGAATLAAEAAVWAKLLQGDQLTAAQRTEVQLTLAETTARANEKASEDWDKLIQKSREMSTALQEEIGHLKEVSDEFNARLLHDNDELDHSLTELQTKMERLNTQMAKDSKELLDQEMQPLRQLMGEMGSVFDAQVSKVVSGSETMGVAVSKMATEMAEKFVEKVVDMIAEWVAFEVITGIFGGGIASDLGLSGGPIANLLGFDTGAWEIPNTQLAVVHEGEMIIPAGPAASVRSANSAGISAFPSLAMTPAAVANMPALSPVGAVSSAMGSAMQVNTRTGITAQDLANRGDFQAGDTHNHFSPATTLNYHGSGGRDDADSIMDKINSMHVAQQRRFVRRLSSLR